MISLYDEQATKTAIISKMQNDLARRVKSDDRVIFFFAGHGYTEELGGEDNGYIVPYDGGDISATFISMDELRSQSRKMGNAKHQLFVLDACYGGLFGERGARSVNENLPNYLTEIIRRPARQFLTAGGKDQSVQDGGPGGHSYFTYYFLEALQEGLGDVNGDGYITFAELDSYIKPRASNSYQTPASGTLPGHGMGEFVFRSPKGERQHLRNIEAIVQQDDAKAMLVARGFFDSWRNEKGIGLANRYESQKIAGEPVVLDRATGLMWQKGGSPHEMSFTAGAEYIRTFNETKFAGFSDWRLPTLEEAMSLMEPKAYGDLHIEPIFDQKQKLIWTVDKENASMAWVVNFQGGLCDTRDVGNSLGKYVRAVRTMR